MFLIVIQIQYLPKEVFPLSFAKLDIYVYRTVYDVNWNKPLYMTKSPLDEIRTALLHLRFDEHIWEYKKIRFEKGKECRFNFSSYNQGHDFELKFGEEKIEMYSMIYSTR